MRKKVEWQEKSLNDIYDFPVFANNLEFSKSPNDSAENIVDRFFLLKILFSLQIMEEVLIEKNKTLNDDKRKKRGRKKREEKTRFDGKI